MTAASARFRLKKELRKRMFWNLHKIRKVSMQRKQCSFTKGLE